MSKVRNFSEIAPNIAFPEFNFYDLYRSTFEKSELGRIKKLLPLREMAENFGLVRKSMKDASRSSLLKGKWPYILEDVHGAELPETDGTVERQHPLPDILRRNNRSDTPIDEL